MARYSICLVVLAAGLVSAPADAQTPAITVSQPQLVSGGAGDQTEPHISGRIVSFTNVDSQSTIRFADLSDPSQILTVPPGATSRDSLSDVSGHTIVFRRDDGSSTVAIGVIDTSDPALTVHVLAPLPGARRSHAAIGGDTVAFQQLVISGGIVTGADICVASAADYAAPAECLTSDGATATNDNPSVSPDGTTVAFQKCRGGSCDVFVRRRVNGVWEGVTQLSFTGIATLPDTNGTVVTFQSGGDVWYENVDSSGSHQIVFTDVTGSIEGNPNISGDVITFERSLVSGGPKDLYAYKIGTNSLFQLTDTPDVNEKLNDVSIDLDGRFRVVWSQPEVPGTISPNDVWFAEFEIAADAPIYTTQTMFDQSRSYKLGSVVPIRLQLLDANGANVSSPSVALTATALVHKDNTASATVTDAGNSNPDNAFRYDATLGGYAFNLSTKNLSAGTWELQFTATGDTRVYSITFSLR